MWPKLLKSTVIEAVRLDHHGKGSAVDAATVAAFLRGTNSVQETITGVDRRTKLIKRDSASQLWVESRDGITWVHRLL